MLDKAIIFIHLSNSILMVVFLLLWRKEVRQRVLREKTLEAASTLSATDPTQTHLSMKHHSQQDYDNELWRRALYKELDPAATSVLLSNKHLTRHEPWWGDHVIDNHLHYDPIVAKEAEKFSLAWKDTGVLPTLPEATPYAPVLIRLRNDGDNVRVAKFVRLLPTEEGRFVMDGRDVPIGAIGYWVELMPTTEQERELKRMSKNREIRSNAILAIGNLGVFDTAYAEANYGKAEPELDISELSDARQYLDTQLRRYNDSTEVPVTEEDTHFAVLRYWTDEVNSFLAAAQVMLHSGTRNTN